MNSASIEFPGLPKVDAALRGITEHLAREFTFPTAEPPLWTEFEWRIARAVAAMQGVSSLLCARLRWDGPPNWRRFLEEQRDHVAERHRQIEKLLELLDAEASRQGIALVPLKGAALHANGIYAAGERPMADVDLLVQAVDSDAMTHLLARHGFEVTFTSWRDQLFESKLRKTIAGLGEHADNPIKIELHTNIRERLPAEIDITKLVFPSTPRAGLNAYSSTVSLMIHLLLHAAGNMRANALRLIQLHDIALLAVRFGPQEWEELLSIRLENRGLWWAMPPLKLTTHYYPAAVPQAVTARLGQECPWLLVRRSGKLRLADVSWSNMWVHAFPGIEWSRSPQEAVTFMISRLWPGRERELEAQHLVNRHPGASEIPWYGISQRSRILRWLFSKPPRVQTLVAVRAALSQCDDDPDHHAGPECVSPTPETDARPD
jgi:Uncharacterised nucleotidyltransferase